MDWNLESCALVRFAAASPARDGSKLCRVFLLSSNFRKSEMLSSSVCNEPELPPAPSANIPEPGWAEEDERLCFPLLPWSSSTLLAPPYESFPRLWLKLLLYLDIDPGFGELDVEEVIVCSGTIGTPRNEAGIPAVSEDRLRGCVRALSPGVPVYDCGEVGRTMPPRWFKEVPGTGDADREPALNGWNDKDGLLAIAMPSKARDVVLEV
jgi:hypothetical protein